MTYRLIDIMWRIVAKLPFKALYSISDIAFVIVFHLVRYRRRVVATNLRNSFPEKSDDERRQIECEFYHCFCDYVVETLKMRDMDAARIKKHIRFEGLDILDKHTSQGRSCVVYMSHSFNWEWVTSLPLHVADEKVQFGQIYHPLENAAMDKLFFDLRGKYGAMNIAMKDTLRAILRILRDGKVFVVGFIADQVPYWEGIDHWVTFLNQDTPVFGGGEKIARRTNAAALFMSVHKEKRGYYVARFEELATDNVKDMPEHQLTELYFKAIERFLNEYPANWLWTHKRWKRTRAGYEERERLRREQRKKL